MSDWIWALIIGFVLDLLLGDPSWLYHPVCLIGNTSAGWKRSCGGVGAICGKAPCS